MKERDFLFLGAHFAVVLSGLPLSPLSEVKEQELPEIVHSGAVGLIHFPAGIPTSGNGCVSKSFVR